MNSDEILGKLTNQSAKLLSQIDWIAFQSANRTQNVSFICRTHSVQWVSTDTDEMKQQNQNKNRGARRIKKKNKTEEEPYGKSGSNFKWWLILAACVHNRS